MSFRRVSMSADAAPTGIMHSIRQNASPVGVSAPVRVKVRVSLQLVRETPENTAEGLGSCRVIATLSFTVTVFPGPKYPTTLLPKESAVYVFALTDRVIGIIP
jgi:hypothetical protein